LRGLSSQFLRRSSPIKHSTPLLDLEPPEKLATQASQSCLEIRIPSPIVIPAASLQLKSERKFAISGSKPTLPNKPSPSSLSKSRSSKSLLKTETVNLNKIETRSIGGRKSPRLKLAIRTSPANKSKSKILNKKSPVKPKSSVLQKPQVIRGNKVGQHQPSISNTRKSTSGLVPKVLITPTETSANSTWRQPMRGATACKSPLHPTRATNNNIELAKKKERSERLYLRSPAVSPNEIKTRKVSYVRPSLSPMLSQRKMQMNLNVGTKPKHSDLNRQNSFRNPESGVVKRTAVTKQMVSTPRQAPPTGFSIRFNNSKPVGTKAISSNPSQTVPSLQSISNISKRADGLSGETNKITIEEAKFKNMLQDAQQAAKAFNAMVIISQYLLKSNDRDGKNKEVHQLRTQLNNCREDKKLIEADIELLLNQLEEKEKESLVMRKVFKDALDSKDEKHKTEILLLKKTCDEEVSLLSANFRTREQEISSDAKISESKASRAYEKQIRELETKVANLEDEVGSLTSVLNLRNIELKDVKQANDRMTTVEDENIKIKRMNQNFQLRIRDLEENSVFLRKNEIELKSKLETCKETIRSQKHVNDKISADTEQLRWKLGNRLKRCDNGSLGNQSFSGETEHSRRRTNPPASLNSTLPILAGVCSVNPSSTTPPSSPWSASSPGVTQLRRGRNSISYSLHCTEDGPVGETRNLNIQNTSFGQ